MDHKQISSKKQDLFSTFQAAGLEDAMKKEMRARIIQKLQTFTPSAMAPSFQNRLIVSLVSEYLTYNTLLYSNSLFLPETGYEGRTLNRHELASLKCLNQITLESSILEHLIGREGGVGVEGSCQDREVQTHEVDFSLSIEQKFGFLEDEYKEKLRRNQSREVLDMASVRREIELEFKEQYDRDLTRFKEFEIESVRLNEREKVKRKYEEHSARLEENYKRKIQQLRRQTSKMYDQQESMRKEKEYFSTQERASLTQQRELLRMKQFQIDEKSRLLDMSKTMESQSIRKSQQQLSDKIKEYDTLNLRMVEKINYEVGLVKLSLQKEYQDKQIEFLEKKKVVDEEYAKIQSIKSSVQIIERENTRLFEQNTQLRAQLQGSLEQVSALLQDTKQSASRIQTIRSQRQSLKQEVKQLEESKRDLSVKLNKYQNELVSTRKQLQDARNRTGDYKSQSQDQIQLPPAPIQKESAVEDLFRKMEEITKNRRKDIESLKGEIDE